MVQKAKQDAAFEKAMRTWRAFPERFIHDVLGWKPWDKQVEILHSIIDNKETYVKSCNAAGKSYLAAALVIWWLFTRRGKVVTTAPTWRQVREVLWANIGAQCERAHKKLGMKPLQSSLKLGPDWYAVGLSTKVPDKFQGYHGNVLVVVDEASGVNDSAIWDAIDGNLTDNKHDRLLAIGNPLDPTSVFASKFKVPLRKGWNSHITISAFDTPNVKTGTEVVRGMVTREWVEMKTMEWGVTSPQYLARVLGEFPKTGLQSLFPIHWLERAFAYNSTDSWEPVIVDGAPTGEYEVIPGMPDLSSGVKSLGLDVAGSGMDNNAMCYMTGYKLQDIVGWPTVDSSDILGDDDIPHDNPTFFGWVRKYRPDVGVIDALGLGDPIYKYARKYRSKNKMELGRFRIRAFKASNAAVKDDKYENYKAESYFKVRDLLSENGLDLSLTPLNVRDTIINQANAIRWQTSKRGLIMIESKDQMRSRVPEIGSPDELESLIMSIVGGKRAPTDSQAGTAGFDYTGTSAEYEDVGGVANWEYDFDKYGRR